MNMTRQMALGLVLAMVISSAAVDAQVGGLIRRKAGDIVGGKKPAPTPAPATPAPAPTDPAPATPATGGAKTAPPAKGKAAASPLEISELPVSQSTTAFLRGETELPFIPSATVAAARVLGESAQAALVDTIGAAVKSLVMSPAFLTQHNEYIKSKHQAVDHGIKGAVSMEDALKKNDLKAVEALQRNAMVAMGVDMVANYPGDALKGELTNELKRWRTYAADPKRRDRAKYQKMVDVAQTIESLPGTDEKFKRGYAVIKSIDNDGPDTEAAVYAIHTRFQQEKEQAAYDQFNLTAQLRARLTSFIAIASKVNFNAPTAEKDGKTVFVNAADEKRSALWKACFRAGEAPTAAAVKLAKAWLSEL
jgi:hypothetical protein